MLERFFRDEHSPLVSSVVTKEKGLNVDRWLKGLVSESTFPERTKVNIYNLSWEY
jgi:hypothetical protein